MSFEVDELRIELAPLKAKDMLQFVKNGGLQSLTVTKYLGMSMAPVLEDEYEWFAKARSDETTVSWGIYLVDGKQRKLIGNTGLSSINRDVMSYAVSGFLIFRPEYWGKGIASACHKARTYYACTQLGVHQIRSAVFDGNTGSRIALERVGYVPIFHERNRGFVDGEYIGATSFSLINPLEISWNHWWHGDEPSPEFIAARERTLEALEWGKKHISF